MTGPKSSAVRSLDGLAAREAGFGTVVTAFLTAGILVIGLVLVGAGLWLQARHTAADAADLTALGIAQAALRGMAEDEACSTGEQIARDNHAELVDCDVAQVQEELAVAVTVSVDAPWKLPGLPDELTATSFAGNPREG